MAERTGAGKVRTNEEDGDSERGGRRGLTERELFEVTLKNLKVMRLDRSPAVPHTFEEWVEYRAGVAADKKAERRRKKALMATNQSSPCLSILPFAGRSFQDGRSAVLAQHTIWTSWDDKNSFAGVAQWPLKCEFKEEGDERHTSGFGRFLPIPRVTGNETVVWKQKPYLDACVLDMVSPVPITTYTAPLDTRKGAAYPAIVRVLQTDYKTDVAIPIAPAKEQVPGLVEGNSEVFAEDRGSEASGSKLSDVVDPVVSRPQLEVQVLDDSIFGGRMPTYLAHGLEEVKYLLSLSVADTQEPDIGIGKPDAETAQSEVMESNAGSIQPAKENDGGVPKMQD